jgi:hypothetical protein
MAKYERPRRDGGTVYTMLGEGERLKEAKAQRGSSDSEKVRSRLFSLL